MVRPLSIPAEPRPVGRLPGAGVSRAWSLLALLCLGALPFPLHAQSTDAYTFVLRGVPLDEALHRVIRATRLDLSYDPALVADKRVYCVAEQEPPEAILRCILRGTGLDFFRLSSGLYVLTEAAAAPPRRGNLHGIVVDHETGDPLPNAHVLLADGSTGAVSNEDGRFLIADLLPGVYRLTASYLGYRPRVDSVRVPPDGAARTRLDLFTEPLAVAPIVVDGLQWHRASDSLGSAALDPGSLLTSPAGGLPDVARGLGTLVGVRLNDATADLHVQGGESGEHQFQLDGAPVFVPVSIGGLVGPFSPFALGRVTVHKTGFGAAAGSQTAGVIQAEHALGPVAGRTVEIQADPLSANARVGLGVGTPGRLQASILLAGRYGLWDVYAPPAVRHLLDEWNRADPFLLTAFAAAETVSDETGSAFRRTFSTGDPRVGFYDLHAAARVRFGTLRSLYVSTYQSRRELDSDQNAFESLTSQALAGNPQARDVYAWHNRTAQARLESVVTPRVLASLRGRASVYRLRHDVLLVSSRDLADSPTALRLDPLADNDNRIQEYAVGMTLDVAARNAWNATIGVEPTYTFNRFLVQGTQRLPITHRSSGWRVASFWTNHLTLTSRWTLDAGLRLTYLGVRRTAYAEPRLAFRYDHPGGALGPWSLRLASGLYRQFVNQFDVSSRSARGLLATSRTWLGVDASVAPPLAAHLAADLLVQPAPGLTLRLESFYKKHLHLLAINYSAGVETAGSGNEYTDDPGGLSSLPQSAFLAGGEGQTYGGALVAEKRWRHVRVEGRYEYTHARRTFGLFFAGNSVPPPWNEPYRLEGALDWTPRPNLTFVARWRGIWGRTWGFRQSYYDFLGAYPSLNLTEALADANLVVNIRDQIRAFGLAHPEDHRLPPVYQLDVSAAYALRLGAATLQTRLDVLNVLDRDNVADWRFIFDPDTYSEDGLLRRDERLLLPFTPALAVRLAW